MPLEIYCSFEALRDEWISQQSHGVAGSESIEFE